MLNSLLWGDEIDIVDIAKILQFEEPVSKLLRRQILAIALVWYVMILTKHAPQITSREEDCATSIVPLNTWLWSYSVLRSMQWISKEATS